MTTQAHLIMPMAGFGSRFAEFGILEPKPLIRLNGKPFFYFAAQSVKRFANLCSITFVVLKEHKEKYAIDEKIREYYPNAGVYVLPKVLPGAVYTALEGIADIDDDLPIIINDCDHAFKCASLKKAFEEGSAPDFDGALLTFPSQSEHFSYIKYDENKNIMGTVEKKVVSESAICGAYIFKNADIFRKAAAKYVKNCPYNECFISGLYNIILSDGGKVAEFKIDRYLSFGTPEEYESAIYKISDYE